VIPLIVGNLLAEVLAGVALIVLVFVIGEHGRRGDGADRDAPKHRCKPSERSAARDAARHGPRQIVQP